MAKLGHNQRYNHVHIAFSHGAMNNQINIRNAILWRMDEDTVDIAHYGENLPVVSIYLDEIKHYSQQDDKLVIHL